MSPNYWEFQNNTAMRTAIIFSTLTILTLIAGCKKYTNAPDDLGGQNYIRGRVFFADTLDYDLKSVNFTNNYLPGATIYLAYADSNNFIYSVSADQNGYFTFANLKNQQYWIYADTVLDSLVHYSSYEPVTLNNNSPDTIALVVYPSQAQQNGVLYIVKDSANTGFLTGASVCLFNSPAVFQHAMATDSCTGCNYSALTNGAGRAWQLNMAPGFYNVLLTFQLGASTKTATDTITVGPTGIIERMVNLN